MSRFSGEGEETGSPCWLTSKVEIELRLIVNQFSSVRIHYQNKQNFFKVVRTRCFKNFTVNGSDFRTVQSTEVTSDLYSQDLCCNYQSFRQNKKA